MTGSALQSMPLLMNFCLSIVDPPERSPLGTRLTPGIASSVAASLEFGSAKWDIDYT
ncbi:MULTISPECIES: hypothetical protein [unclassified Leptolyngbya]|uniref:hypothetical protein n=1 Tax=unclassified Leptolyngbya TaxID=2650499 RepID=UPI001689790D|nr:MULTISPECIES: hypothetical protein [unclassified Leptolyngbya]MBD1910971.1 hypothetical protein [Leptolyngbya sp. FACHB-8]MBD2158362.1 hypothetical protein [Leptolyngbya sp. FACHB-16]